MVKRTDSTRSLAARAGSRQLDVGAGVQLVAVGSSSQWNQLVRTARPLSCLLLKAALLLISLYQRFISPGLRPCCRFVPSCSAYAKECLEKYGLLRGAAKTLWRLLRCHPLCKGGLDQP